MLIGGLNQEGSIKFANIVSQQKPLLNELVVDNPEDTKAMSQEEIDIAIETEKIIRAEQELCHKKKRLDKKGTILNHSCYLEEELIVDNPDDDIYWPTCADMFPSDEEPSWPTLADIFCSSPTEYNHKLTKYLGAL